MSLFDLPSQIATVVGGVAFDNLWMLWALSPFSVNPAFL